MPKMKSHKGAVKRFKKTGTGKIMHRKTGQDHFNNRESGKTTKNKRRDVALNPNDTFIRTLLQ